MKLGKEKRLALMAYLPLFGLTAEKRLLLHCGVLAFVWRHCGNRVFSPSTEAALTLQLRIPTTTMVTEANLVVFLQWCA